MPLTVQQGLDAGSVANEAVVLQNTVAALQGAIAAKATLHTFNIAADIGPLHADLALSQDDSLSLMNLALTIYQTMLNAKLAQLQAMG